MVTSHDLTGSRLGDYEIGERLGKGGMGEVYQAVDTRRGRRVALKLLSSAIADDTSARDRFMRESRTAATLTDPHILPIHDWGEIDGQLFIDMRLVGGRDLRRVISEDGPMSPKTAVKIIAQIGSAIDAAHRVGLIHRDVKPDNIVIDDHGFAYLVDFGLAMHVTDTRLTNAGYAIGSFRYMAPERFGVDDVGPQVDIYALTCVLYECLVGVPPFSYATTAEQMIAAHLNADPQKFGSPFDDVIATGMAKRPDARYPDAASLVEAAQKALIQTPDSSPLRVIGPKSTAPLNVSADVEQSVDRPQSADVAQQYATTTLRALPPVNRSRPRILALTVAAVVIVGLGGWYVMNNAGSTTTRTASAPTHTATSADTAEIVWRTNVGAAEVSLWLSSSGYNWVTVAATSALTADARIWSPQSGWRTSQVYASAPTEFTTPRVYAPGSTCIRLIVNYGADTLNDKIC
ncbi:serine/threonine protein kinase [Gordonia sp. TBRC 11910]|uniref:non-specific serine/threonine protein kinase n=1 Tax=Gordonia asplenii TaxID=2725283 RepID=A0A848L3U3_9ACTN|nr:serine/threonine-protein kinase [Gordonia asplenii]NMO02308.1 serine/threonine protein kinase [Gordonia asplenii]